MAVQLKHHHTSTLNRSKHLEAANSAAPQRRSASLRVHAVLGGRAQELIKSGAVTPITPKDAASAMESHGYRLLDIRPEWEREKARVSGSLHVPLFVEDKDNSPITLLKKWVHFGYIGLWTGQLFTMINPSFLQQVEEVVPDKDSKLLVACGEGLRSLIAVATLYKGGYKNLGWLAGGFTRATDVDFPGVEGTEKLQYATIGGASYYFLKLLLLLQAVGKET
ncbi:Rhodanese/Cell cycle control phosphatase superfamily protein [Perilla frutescens var. hirtella]|uniref:Rhodanese/Cell cycle control phosphatase superfamily protein n=1 Tax=Perilla frutescens var. hirtella TaxID=608512 RepID=A0AAD4PEV8_PERFH|nr:Rhodanese/Cell cycle control phosphatase superfamily protein [Perilla frutescens var. hirtella]